ncbi:MAG: DNA-directed RNA polymerase subunit alpha C-terminal domain-containing protein [Candidatus Saccharibacteria bacterium]
MPTKVEIVFQGEQDTDALIKLLQKYVLKDKPLLDFSVCHVDDTGEPIRISRSDSANMSIYLLPLKSRTRNALLEAYWHNAQGIYVRREDKDIQTIGELSRKTELELKKYYNIGKSAIADIRQALASVGLSLEGE